MKGTQKYYSKEGPTGRKGFDADVYFGSVENAKGPKGPAGEAGSAPSNTQYDATFDLLPVGLNRNLGSINQSFHSLHTDRLNVGDTLKNIAFQSPDQYTETSFDYTYTETNGTVVSGTDYGTVVMLPTNQEMTIGTFENPFHQVYAQRQYKSNNTIFVVDRDTNEVMSLSHDLLKQTVLNTKGQNMVLEVGLNPTTQTLSIDLINFSGLSFTGYISAETMPTYTSDLADAMTRCLFRTLVIPTENSAQLPFATSPPSYASIVSTLNGRYFMTLFTEGTSIIQPSSSGSLVYPVYLEGDVDGAPSFQYSIQYSTVGFPESGAVIDRSHCFIPNVLWNRDLNCLEIVWFYFLLEYPDGLVANESLAQNAVVSALIASNAVTNAAIRDSAIMSYALESGLITSPNQLAPGSVGAAQLATPLFTGDSFLSTTKLAENLASGFLTIDDHFAEAAPFSYDVLTSLQLIDRNATQFSAAHWKPKGLNVSRSFADGAITSAKMVNEAISASQLDSTLRSLLSMGSQGLRGRTGDKGATGGNGATGRSGVDGPTGGSGRVGASGGTGATGRSGATGGIGGTGSTGGSGGKGMTGENGWTGSDGRNGLDGSTGSDGPAGPGGVTGDGGPTGRSGTNGVTGDDGAGGPKGPSGVSDVTGSSGRDGPTGSPGENGDQGRMGPTGQTSQDFGATGEIGPTGMTGATGMDGPTGLDGWQGLFGMDGHTGITGATGRSGTDGVDGGTGQTGGDGAIGPSGAAAVDGDAGPAGPDGALASVGPTGQMGGAGVSGASGGTGNTGASGVDGADGVAGSDGAPGATGKRGADGNTGGAGRTGSGGDSGRIGFDGPTGQAGPGGKNGTNGLTGGTGDSGPAGADGPAGEGGKTGLGGADGRTGESGESGFAGSDGSPGRNGQDGESGPAGGQGPNGGIGAGGKSGDDGETGQTGLSGRIGFTGPSGETGMIGENGNLGMTGAGGVSGSNGRDGWTGLDGSSGGTGMSGGDGMAGSAGRDGTNGVDGPTGGFGPNGNTGVQGAGGPFGAGGETGGTGMTGGSGDTGMHGLSGLTGPGGERGMDGVTGSNGKNGLPGDTGDTGSTGLSGSIGGTGPDGKQGLSGFAGPSGLVGRPGGTGEVGAMGPDSSVAGPAGQQGSTVTGSNGAPGPDGARGSVGSSNGPAGSPGQTGPTGGVGPTGTVGSNLGPAGRTGQTGQQGSGGVTGSNSATGQQGPTGLSTLTYQGSNGNTGRRGPTGDLGITGPTGKDGMDGPTGPTSDVTGAAGPTGRDGPSLAYATRSSVDNWQVSPPVTATYTSNTTTLTGQTGNVCNGVYEMSGSSFTSDQVAFFKAFLADPELNEKWQAAENLYDSGGYIGSVSSLLNTGETVAGEYVQIRFPQAVALKSLRLQAGYGTSNVTYSAGVAINSLQSVSAVAAPTHTAFLFPGSSVPGETMIYEMTIDQADRLPFKILAVGGGGGGKQTLYYNENSIPYNTGGGAGEVVSDAFVLTSSSPRTFYVVVGGGGRGVFGESGDFAEAGSATMIFCKEDTSIRLIAAGGGAGMGSSWSRANMGEIGRGIAGGSSGGSSFLVGESNDQIARTVFGNSGTEESDTRRRFGNSGGGGLSLAGGGAGGSPTSTAAGRGICPATEVPGFSFMNSSLYFAGGGGGAGPGVSNDGGLGGGGAGVVTGVRQGISGNQSLLPLPATPTNESVWTWGMQRYQSGHTIVSMACDANGIHSLMCESDKLYYSTTAGLKRTESTVTTTGASFTCVGVSNSGETMFASSPDGLFLSEDFGHSFSLLSASPGASLSSMYVFGDSSMIGWDGGNSVVVCWDGSNVTTESLPSGASASSAVRISGSVSGEVIYASLAQTGYWVRYTSTEGWTNASWDSEVTVTGVATVSNGSVVYACTQAHGIWKSTDFGDTFVQLTNGPTAACTDIKCSRTGGGQIVSVLTSGAVLFRSNDAGATWTEVLTDLSSVGGATQTFMTENGQHIGVFGSSGLMVASSALGYGCSAAPCSGSGGGAGCLHYVSSDPDHRLSTSTGHGGSGFVMIAFPTSFLETQVTTNSTAATAGPFVDDSSLCYFFRFADGDFMMFNNDSYIQNWSTVASDLKSNLHRVNVCAHIDLTDTPVIGGQGSITLNYLHQYQEQRNNGQWVAPSSDWLPENTLSATSGLTFSTWVKYSPTLPNGGGLVLLSSLQANGNLTGLTIPNDGNNTVRAVCWGSSTLSCSVPEDGNWHSYVFVIQENEEAVVVGSLYRDGVLDGTPQTMSSFPDPSHQYRPILGNVNNDSQYFYGKLAETRIYSRALTSSEISLLYSGMRNEKANSVSATRLVRHYTFDDAEGYIRDYANGDMNLMLFPGNGFSLDPSYCKTGNRGAAINNGGAATYLPDVEIRSSVMTVACWLKCHDSTDGGCNEGVFFSLGNNKINDRLNLKMLRTNQGTNQSISIEIGSSSSYTVAIGEMNGANWVHIGLEFNVAGKGITVFKNGRQWEYISTDASKQMLPPLKLPEVFYNNFMNNGGSVGRLYLDDVRIYDGRLTSQEWIDIQSLGRLQVPAIRVTSSELASNGASGAVTLSWQELNSQLTAASVVVSPPDSGIQVDSFLPNWSTGTTVRGLATGFNYFTFKLQVEKGGASLLSNEAYSSTPTNVQINSVALSSETGNASLSWTVGTDAQVDIRWSPATTTSQPVTVSAGTTTYTITDAFASGTEYTFQLTSKIGNDYPSYFSVYSSPISYAVPTGGIYSCKWINTSGYTGPCFKLRRSSDNVTVDVYANVNGVMGLSAGGTGTTLTTWKSTSTTLYVHTWYDQSGFGKHATQTVTASQPVYSSTSYYVDFANNAFLNLPDGTVPANNGSFTILFNGTQPATTGKRGYLGSGEYTTAGDSNAFYVGNDVALSGYNLEYVNSWNDASTNSVQSTGVGFANTNVATWTYNGSTTSLYVKRSTDLSGSLQFSAARTGRASSRTNNTIGRTNGTEYWGGTMYSLMIFDSALSDSTRIQYENNATNPLATVSTVYNNTGAGAAGGKVAFLGRASTGGPPTKAVFSGTYNTFVVSTDLLNYSSASLVNSTSMTNSSSTIAIKPSTNELFYFNTGDGVRKATFNSSTNVFTYSSTVSATASVNSNDVVYRAMDSSLVLIRDNALFTVNDSTSNQTYTLLAGNQTTTGAAVDNATLLNARFNNPRTLTMDWQGLLYVADYSNGWIRRVDIAQNKVNNYISVTSPTACAFDGSGNMYVMSNTGYLYKYAAGSTTTSGFIAGNGTSGGSAGTINSNGDGGLAIAAIIYMNAYLSIDPYGRLLVGETSSSYQNNKFRMITLPSTNPFTQTTYTDSAGTWTQYWLTKTETLCSLPVVSGSLVSILCIGGGGGGAKAGGGGGAGGVVQSQFVMASDDTLTCYVGVGGMGNFVTNGLPFPGGTSTVQFATNTGNNIAAVGGGSGYGAVSSSTVVVSGSSGTAGQGYPGGNCAIEATTWKAGAGGGGAGGAGADAETNGTQETSVGGSGGTGTVVTISGHNPSYYWAGGGGGGGQGTTTTNTGGRGGGGAGANSGTSTAAGGGFTYSGASGGTGNNAAAGDAVPNTGSGGGGGWNSTSGRGGHGGSGIVVVSILPSFLSITSAVYVKSGTVVLSWSVKTPAAVSISWTPTTATSQPVVVAAGTLSATLTGFTDGTAYTFVVSSLASNGITVTSSVNSSPLQFSALTHTTSLPVFTFGQSYATLNWTSVHKVAASVSWTPSTPNMTQPIMVAPGQTSLDINDTFTPTTDYTFSITPTATSSGVALSGMSAVTRTTSPNAGYAPASVSSTTSVALGVPITTSTFGYSTICTSSTGQYVYMASSTTGLYKSSDYGNSFTNINQYSSTTVQGANSVDCSSDGSVVYLVSNTNVYRSTTYGAAQSFTKLTSSNNIEKYVSCDGTGGYATWVVYGAKWVFYTASTNTETNLSTNTAHGFLSAKMAKTGPLVMAFANKKGGAGTGAMYLCKTAYAGIGSFTATNLNSANYDVTILDAGMSDDGNRCYIPVAGGTPGVFNVTNRATTALATTARLTFFGTTVGYLSSTVQSSKNFAAVSTNSTSVVYYTMNNGTSWSTLTLPFSSNTAQIWLTSYVSTSNQVVLLLNTSSATTGVYSYRITIV